MAVGALWSGIAGVLKTTRGVSEVISTIMLNPIVTSGLAAYLLNHYFEKPTSATDLTTKTHAIPRAPGSSRTHPRVARGHLLRPHRRGDPRDPVLRRGVADAIRLRPAGDRRQPRRRARERSQSKRHDHQDHAALRRDRRPRRHEGPLRSSTRTRWTSRPGLGFAGIAVALVGRNNPGAIAIGALLFGFLERSAQILDLNNIPKEIFQIMEAIIILSVVIAYEVVRRRIQAQEVRAAAAKAQSRAPNPEEPPDGERMNDLAERVGGAWDVPSAAGLLLIGLVVFVVLSIVRATTNSADLTSSGTFQGRPRPRGADLPRGSRRALLRAHRRREHRPRGHDDPRDLVRGVGRVEFGPWAGVVAGALGGGLGGSCTRLPR